jgi:phosphoribosylformylglycinamidine cyclo-ligase
VSSLRHPVGKGNDMYSATGVDYAVLDGGKRLALTAALATSPLLEQHGGRSVDESRGQSAFVFEFEGRSFGFVVEGLGTKAVIARQFLEQAGDNRFADVAYDTVAAIVNDLCSTGALPLVVNAYFATGNASWLEDEDRFAALLDGWRRGCEDSRCTWGGGESPSLPGLVTETDIELAGSAVGVLPEGVAPILGQDLAPGDEIVLVESSGLHANGASLARAVAADLPDGLSTEMPSGQSFGAGLLAPSVIYADLVARTLEAGVPVTYLSHITGHGFLKIMRSMKPLTYRLTKLLDVPEVLSFMVDSLGMEVADAYSTFNMGAGMAVYCAAGRGAEVVQTADELGLRAVVAGAVEEGPRSVVIEPVGVTFGSDDMVLAPT